MFVKGRVEILRRYGCRKIRPDLDNDDIVKWEAGFDTFVANPLVAVSPRYSIVVM